MARPKPGSKKALKQQLLKAIKEVRPVAAGRIDSRLKDRKQIRSITKR